MTVIMTAVKMLKRLISRLRMERFFPSALHMECHPRNSWNVSEKSTYSLILYRIRGKSTIEKPARNAPENHPPVYPLTAPEVMPAMMYFCMKTNMIATGIMETTAKADR